MYSRTDFMASTGKGTTDREKKPKLNERKKNKREQSPCAAASGADAPATGKSGDDCTDGEGVLGDLLFKNLKSLDENRITSVC